MSFTITEFPITVKDEADIPAIAYSIGVAGIWVTYGSVAPKLRTIPPSTFALAVHDHTEIKAGGGSIFLTVGGQARVESASTLWLKTLNGHNVYFHTAGNDVQTYPSGAGIDIYADGFVEWSMLRNKTEIKPLPDQDAIIESVQPREFKIAGKSRLGFIVEELPTQFIRVTTDDDGKTVKGVGIMDMLAALYKTVQSLLFRVTALEEERVS